MDDGQQHGAWAWISVVLGIPGGAVASFAVKMLLGWRDGTIKALEKQAEDANRRAEKAEGEMAMLKREQDLRVRDIEADRDRGWNLARAAYQGWYDERHAHQNCLFGYQRYETEPRGALPPLPPLDSLTGKLP